MAATSDSQVVALEEVEQEAKAAVVPTGVVVPKEDGTRLGHLIKDSDEWRASHGSHRRAPVTPDGTQRREPRGGARLRLLLQVGVGRFEVHALRIELGGTLGRVDALAGRKPRSVPGGAGPEVHVGAWPGGTR